MRPRSHNVLSYSVSILVFWGVLVWRARGVGYSGLVLLGAALFTCHFVRRSVESAFVHRYSKPRIGPGDYLTEYLYYWGFGAWIAWSISATGQHAPAVPVRALGLLVFVLAEAGNAHAHLVLRNLRTQNGLERSIPRGFLFERVSCPHYLFEILSWLGFNLVTGTWAGVAFMLVGAGILSAWARTRHLAYRQQFDGQDGRASYPPQRRALIPNVF